MKLAALTAVLVVAFASASANQIISDHFIDEINRAQNTWTAGRNFHPRTSANYIRGLLGVHPAHRQFMPPVKHTEVLETEEIPEEFHPRQKWPQCPSIKEIR